MIRAGSGNGSFRDNFISSWRPRLMVVCWLFLSALVACHRPPTVRNDVPRRDVRGDIIDAHDGCLEYFGGTFYLYGTAYGNTDGFSRFNRLVCYSSKDLVNWVPHGEIIKFPSPAVYYRPHVKYCRKTGKYVLWFNWYPKCCLHGAYGVATADRPEGPFTIHSLHATVKYADSPGDFDLFIDEDGGGYLIYTEDTDINHPAHHRMYIERLSPDYLSPTGETSDFLAANVEAPAMFKRQGLYYVLFDNTCCFCKNGSGVRVHTSKAPLGPYTYRGNINRAGPKVKDLPSPDTEAGTGRSDSIIPAQQAQIATIPARNGPLYLWIGDRWQSAPDGIKGHDFQYWSSPLEFDADGMIKQLKWQDAWSVALK